MHTWIQTKWDLKGGKTQIWVGSLQCTSKCSLLGRPGSSFLSLAISTVLQVSKVSTELSGLWWVEHRGLHQNYTLIRERWKKRTQKGRREQRVLILLPFQVLGTMFVSQLLRKKQVRWHFHHRLCCTVDRWHRRPCKPPRSRPASRSLLALKPLRKQLTNA